MPYLKESVAPSDPDLPVFGAGMWMSETKREEWAGRSVGCRLRESWLRESGLTPDDAAALRELSTAEKKRHLEVLAKDVGSVQRDGFMYANLLEHLKSLDPGETLGDQVVSTMRGWGFASATLEPSAGGPPEVESPRLVQKVRDWLFDLLSKVGRILLNAADAFMKLAMDLIASIKAKVAVAVEVGLPPALGINVDVDASAEFTPWSVVKKFANDILDEMGTALA
jgi:hypothetical protein